jgi:thiol:disulfide interchange protein DsbD
MGSFFAGVLAVLAATPCTAPFMGAAMGVAFSQSNFVVVLTFVGLGFGLALPYLLFSLVPGLGRLIPKPGQWMQVLKEILSFPLFATSAWLIGVLSHMVGSSDAQSALFVLVGFGLILWAYRFMHARYRERSWIFILLILGITAYEVKSIGGRSGISVAAEWEVFDPAKVSTYVKQGRGVFVDFTAEWCLTCKVNEHVALNDADVLRAFKERKIVTMRADWTSGDPMITLELKKHARVGVPLYLYYAPDGTLVVLPEILSPKTVLEKIGSQKQ